ncbi:pyruvate dehydrogenase E1 component subunit alpha [Spirochaetia bacterium]|nr:pyruvate dehydrogenase E1 component subunit alpha [Spirochaetia bacterium]
MTIPIDKKKALLYSMLRIRRTEERIEAEYLNDQMRTPVHLYIGQEAIAAGTCAVLRTDDTISSNHRSHGHYLAKGGDLNAMIAELHCRATGCSKGFGGSMHLIDTTVGHLGSSSIVGGGIPIGTGHALAFMMRGEDRVSVVFLGDGASEEGVFYESINFAVLKKLPVIYVLENNGIAVCSPLKNRQPGPSIFHRAYPQEQLSTACIDGNNVEDIYGVASAAVQRARQGKGPSFIECKTYRILGHLGTASQDVTGYRDPSEVEVWRNKCPIETYKKQLLEEGILSPEKINEMEDTITKEIAAAFSFALSSPFPNVDDLLRTVYCD